MAQLIDGEMFDEVLEGDLLTNPKRLKRSDRPFFFFGAARPTRTKHAPTGWYEWRGDALYFLGESILEPLAKEAA